MCANFVLQRNYELYIKKTGTFKRGVEQWGKYPIERYLNKGRYTDKIRFMMEVKNIFANLRAYYLSLQGYKCAPERLRFIFLHILN